MSNDGPHKCPKDDCEEQLSFTTLACKKHWFEIPISLRREINRTWRSGDLVAYSEAREFAVALLNEVHA